MTRDDGLAVLIEDGVLKIMIGVDALAYAICFAPDLEKYNQDTGEFEHPQIIDADVFAQEILHRLKAESETGITPVHRLLDQAAADAIEQGAEGVKLPGEEP